MISEDDRDNNSEEDSDEEEGEEEGPQVPVKDIFTRQTGSRKSSTEFRVRNQIAYRCWKAYFQTGMLSATLFLTDKGRISTICTSGDFFHFVRAVARCQTYAGANGIKTNIAELIHSFNDENIHWSFDKLRSFAEDLKIDGHLIDEAQSRYLQRVSVGGAIKAKESFREHFSAAIEASSLDFYHENSASETPNATAPSRSPVRFQESDAALDLIPYVLKNGGDNLKDLDTFKLWWLEQWLPVSSEIALKWESISQDSLNPITKLRSKNKEWLRARLGRFTGSIIGSLLGYGYTSKDRALRSFICSQPFEKRSTFEKDMLMWGSYMEHEALRCLKEILFDLDPHIKFEENGFFVNFSSMHLGASPDLVGRSTIFGKFGGEIKCPCHSNYKYIERAPDGEELSSKVYPIYELPNGKQGHCPPQYWCQMQLCMYALNIKKYCFFVWTPQRVQLEWYDRDDNFISDIMLPTSKHIYENEMLPMLFNELQKLLQGEHVQVHEVVATQELDSRAAEEAQMMEADELN